MDRTNQRDYTVKELAALAGVSPSRIRQILGEKNSPLAGSIIRGGARFIPADVAHKWLDSRRR